VNENAWAQVLSRHHVDMSIARVIVGYNIIVLRYFMESMHIFVQYNMYKYITNIKVSWHDECFFFF